MHNGTWEINQLATGTFDVERTFVPIDRCCIGSVATNRGALHRVGMATGWVGALLPAPESGKVFIDGLNVAAGDAVLLRSGVEVELVTHGVGRLYMIAHHASVADPPPAPWSSGCGVRVANVAGLPEDVRELLATPDIAFADAQATASLQSRLVGWLSSATERAVDPRAARHDLPRRRLAVERARRFIHEHLAEPIRLPELCRHAHIQARSLEYGFRDLVGMSPIRYVKMLRLGEVRRRLQASSAGACSVSEVALDCGFCHLSQFAVDYKKVFMESPSATRRADHSGWPPKLRMQRAGRGAPVQLVAV